MKLFDTRGLEIRIGSHIVYAVKGSTSIEVHQATVLRVLERLIYARRLHDKKNVLLRKTNSIVVVEPLSDPLPNEDSVQLRVQILGRKTKVTETRVINRLPEFRVDSEELLQRNLAGIGEKVSQQYIDKTRTQ